MFGRFVVLVAAAAVAASASSESTSYNGHAVLRVIPETKEQLQAVHGFLKDHPALDVWAEPSMPGLPVDLRVSPTERGLLEKLLRDLGLQPEVFIRDVQLLVAQQEKQMNLRRRANPQFGWDNYHRLDEIYNWLDQIAAQYNSVATVIEGGRSYEGRKIRGLKISFGNDLPIAFVEAGIHAREWITPAAATYFIDQILNNQNATIQQIVRGFEWHIFPSVNPDGYEYSHKSDRMWRKTRSKNWYLFSGVDANRNWPFHWNEGGSSSLPFMPTYAGPKAESEIETQTLRSYVDSVANRTKAYFCLHSYSQLLMFPWSYTTELTPTHKNMLAVAQAGADYIKSHSNIRFTVGAIADTIYVAAGSTVDYAYSKGIPYPFAFELRDKGQYGFLLPPEQIVDASDETFGAVYTMLREIKKRNYQ